MHILFYITIFIFITATAFAGHNVDCDLWQRLLQGEYVLEHGTVMPNDPFSYVKVHEYIDYEWGSGVVFFLVLKYFGYAGLTFLKALTMFLMMLFVFLAIKSNGLKNTKLYNILFFFFACNCFDNLLFSGVRCQSFTFLFFAIYLYILEEVAGKNRDKLLYILPFVMIFWCNMHGGCVAGIGLIVLYAIGEALNGKPFKKYLYAAAGTVAALFANPYGITYISSLFRSITMNRDIIAEWQSIIEIEPYQLIKSKIFSCFALATTVITLLKTVKSKAKIDFTKYFVLACMFYLAFSHIKHIPFLIIVSLVFLYDDFFGIFNSGIAFLKKVLRITDGFSASFVRVKEFLSYAIILFISVTVIIFNSINRYSAKELTRYPVRLVEFMKINNLKGAILNNFGVGSFLAYKLYPQNRIYMDGRYEALYYDETTRDNINFYYFDRDFQNVFIKEGFPHYIIINKTDEIYKHKELLTMYSQVFEDKLYVLMIRNDLKKDEYLQPVDNDEYYAKTYFDKF